MTSTAPHVSQYMTRVPYTIQRNATLEEAHRRMRKHQIRHLPVLDNDKLVGIVSMDDLHLIESLQGVDPQAVPVEDAMTSDPYVVAEDAPLDRVASAMASRKIGSALVERGGEVVGVFTTIDALVALLHVWKTRP